MPVVVHIAENAASTLWALVDELPERVRIENATPVFERQVTRLLANRPVLHDPELIVVCVHVPTLWTRLMARVTALLVAIRPVGRPSA
jgi:hypothetical protein